MPRVPRLIAQDLIQYAKSINVKANFFDPQSRSAFEFARQMSSPKLKKINPSFECQLELTEDSVTPALKAEFLDGSKWAVDTTAYTADKLRYEFYMKAAEAEDNVDITPGGDAGSKGGKAAEKGKGKK